MKYNIFYDLTFRYPSVTSIWYGNLCKNSVTGAPLVFGHTSKKWKISLSVSVLFRSSSVMSKLSDKNWSKSLYSWSMISKSSLRRSSTSAILATSESGKKAERASLKAARAGYEELSLRSFYGKPVEL